MKAMQMKMAIKRTGRSEYIMMADRKRRVGCQNGAF